MQYLLIYWVLYCNKDKMNENLLRFEWETVFKQFELKYALNSGANERTKFGILDPFIVWYFFSGLQQNISFL